MISKYRNGISVNLQHKQRYQISQGVTYRTTIELGWPLLRDVCYSPFIIWDFSHL